MNERLRDQIVDIANMYPDSPYRDAYIDFARTSQEFTRDENPTHHACVYFAAYDPRAGLIYVGHHKKSGLWLFNGGHIDEGELPHDAFEREVSEEWGIPVDSNVIGLPQLITTTEIDNPVQTCRMHYDIWYFVPVDSSNFNPNPDLISKEFHENRWMSIDDAREIVTDPSTLVAIAEFNSIFNNS